MKELENWLTVKEYGRKYGVSINTIYKQVRSGLHKVVKKGNQKLIYDQKPVYRSNTGPQVFKRKN
jgi:predicted site-specific integrase-resolvase